MTDGVRLAVTKALCEESYAFFARYMFKQFYGASFLWNWHHELICKELQAAADGSLYKAGYDGLIINIPPRYSKTELAVILFTPWVMAKSHGRAQFMHLSYAQDLVYNNSDLARAIIQSPEYQQFWPLAMGKDKSSKKWSLANGGKFYAAPTGGQVTGFGAGLLMGGPYQGAMLLDDLIKPEDAESDLKRDKVNRRLNSTIKNRANHRSCPFIMIMQRVHDNDPAGFAQNGGLGLKFKTLEIPAWDKKKRPLWEHKHTKAELESMLLADKYTFSAQYLQKPVPDDGDYFKRDDCRFYKTLPARLNYYLCSDFAVTPDAGDFTEHGIFGVDEFGNVYVVAWYSRQADSEEWIECALDMVRKYKPHIWGFESGPIRRSVEPWLKKRMQERKDYVTLEIVDHSANNKQGAARAFQALWRMNRVFLPEGQPWAVELLHQLTRFPKGTFDDKVDACSVFGRIINRVWDAERTKLPDAPVKLPEQQVFTVADFYGDE